MNPLYNPCFLLKIIKSYLWDTHNLRRLNDEQLQRYRDKRFRSIVHYAYTVPLYHTLFKQAGVHPSDIKGLDDIHQLPIVSKEDIQEYFPDGIIPESKRKRDLVKVSTSGTTGKSLSIYVDMFDILMGLFGYLRTIQEYDLNWRKHRLSIIGDFAPHTAERGYVQRGLFPRAWFKSLLKNIQWLDTNDKPEHVIEALDRFRPDFIGGYVGMLGHLAVLKENGYGRDVSPQYIAATGAILDPPLKRFIEESFNTSVFEVYGATETGPIAFQCKEKKVYHVMSDLVHLEFLNNGRPVGSKEPGYLIVTKLYGGGTPIIRYNAINDIVAPLFDKHDCGLAGDLIYRIYGRDSIRLYRRDGKVVLAGSLTGIFSKLLYELKTSMIRDVKVIQHSFDEIEVQVVIDENFRNQGASLEEVFSLLQQGFMEKFGRGTNVLIREVKQVSKDEPRILSKIDPKEVQVTGYL